MPNCAPTAATSSGVTPSQRVPQRLRRRRVPLLIRLRHRIRRATTRRRGQHNLRTVSHAHRHHSSDRVPDRRARRDDGAVRPQSRRRRQRRQSRLHAVEFLFKRERALTSSLNESIATHAVSRSISHRYVVVHRARARLAVVPYPSGFPPPCVDAPHLGVARARARAHARDERSTAPTRRRLGRKSSRRYTPPHRRTPRRRRRRRRRRRPHHHHHRARVPRAVARGVRIERKLKLDPRRATVRRAPMDEKKTRASVPPFDARDDVVTTSSSRHRARARIPCHAIPFLSLGPIDRWARVRHFLRT